MYVIYSNYILLFVIIIINSKSICSINKNLDVIYSNNENLYYIIKNGFYYSTNDRYIIRVISNNPIEIDDITKLNKKYKNGGKFECFRNNLTTMSDFDIVNSVIDFIADYSDNNNNLLYDIHKIKHVGHSVVYNSAIVPIDDVYLAIDRSGFFWLNNNFKYDKKLNKNRQYFQYPSSEQDHRLLLLPSGDIILSFTAQIAKINVYRYKIGIRYLYKDKVKDGITLYNNLTDKFILLTKDDTSETTEKNWTPFNYNEDIYFIDKFIPFHIVKIKSIHPNKLTIGSTTYNSLDMITVSQVNCPSIQWIYGGLRGGTPALLVRGQYLSFYHTKSRMLNVFHDISTNARLYFNGAFTFTNTIPFQITSITKYPIINNSFRPYNSNNTKYGHDYVVYFMSFVLVDKFNQVILENEKEEDPKSTEIIITIGVNDFDTVTARMNLNELLKSMIKVECYYNSTTINDSSNENE